MKAFDIRAIRKQEGVTHYPGLDALLIPALKRQVGIELPQDHWDALIETNGIETYFGYFRLFGIGTSGRMDAITWNDYDFWKFAWGERCLDYWCFAETAWGDQYAYSIQSLRKRISAVYFLDALSMTARKLCDSFTEFMADEFQRCAVVPYDTMTREALHAVGPLRTDEHVVYVPSPLLGGKEEIGNIQRMNARSALIANGDIALQLDVGPVDKAVVSVETYEDNSQRTRLRLIWR